MMTTEMPINTEGSGGTRYSHGKPSGWWYAPLKGLELVMPVAKSGGEKYAPKDWQQGQSFSTLLDCAMRHMIAVMHDGVWARDKESGHYHVAHTCWNLLALLTFMALGREDLDDVTVWDGVTATNRAKAQRDKTRRSFSAGRRGRNRVRVFECPKTGIFQVEWRENGKARQRSLKHRDFEKAKDQAQKIADEFLRIS